MSEKYKKKALITQKLTEDPHGLKFKNQIQKEKLKIVTTKNIDLN